MSRFGLRKKLRRGALAAVKQAKELLEEGETSAETAKERLKSVRRDRESESIEPTGTQDGD